MNPTPVPRNWLRNSTWPVPRGFFMGGRRKKEEDKESNSLSKIGYHPSSAGR